MDDSSDMLQTMAAPPQESAPQESTSTMLGTMAGDEQATRRSQSNRRLEEARRRDTEEGDTGFERATRDVARVLPFVGMGYNMGERAQYAGARQRHQSGQAHDDDYEVMARFERHQREEEDKNSTNLGRLGQTALHLPGQIAEVMAGGRAVQAGAGALGIGAAAPTIASRAGMFGAQLAATPGMWAENWQQNNLREGRASFDAAGLPAALAHGALAQAIFGQMGGVQRGVAQRLGGGLLGRIGGTGAAAATGLIEDEAIHTVGQWAGMQTGYGSIHNLITGQPGAVGEVLGQALTFAAFAQMHGSDTGHDLMAGLVKDLKQSARRGESPQRAIEEYKPAMDAMQRAMRDNPNLTREQARQVMEPFGQPGMAIADTFQPQKPSTRSPEPVRGSQEAPEGHAMPAMGPETGHEPYLSQAPGRPQTAPAGQPAQIPSWAVPRGTAGRPDVAGEQHWNNSGTRFETSAGGDTYFKAKDGTPYAINTRVYEPGHHLYDHGGVRIGVEGENGQEVAHAIFDRNPNGSLSAHFENRGAPEGHGVARAMFDFVESKIGPVRRRLNESTVTESKEGKSFWDKNASYASPKGEKRGQRVSAGPAEAPGPGGVPPAGRTAGAPIGGERGPGSPGAELPVASQGTRAASVEDVRSLARSLGLDTKGKQEVLEERIRKAGGQGLLEALVAPAAVVRATSKPTIEGLARAAEAVGNHPADNPQVAAELKSLAKDIPHEIEALSRSTGRSAASIQREIEHGLQQELAHAQTNAPGEGVARAEGAGDVAGPTEVHRGQPEAGGGAAAPAATERGAAGGNLIDRPGGPYADTPHMREMVRQADEIRDSLPSVAEGKTRLWRGARPGETGETRFTDSLEGIALPFAKGYGGKVRYVDVPTSELGKYENKGEPNAFNLPGDLASKAKTTGEAEGQFFGVKPEQRTLVQAAEEGGAPFVRDMPRPPAAPLYIPSAPKARSLLSIIKKGGGLSKESARAHGWDVEAMEEHLPTVFENEKRQKGKMDPTQAAEHLINEGHMLGDKADPMLHDKLAEALTEHAVTLERDLDREAQRDQALWFKENADAIREAARSGINPAEAQKALQAGIEDGARQGIQDGAHQSRADTPESVHEEYAQSAESRTGEAHEPAGGAAGDFNPAEFGRPVSAGERSILPGGGQPNLESGGGGRPQRVTALANAKVDAERKKNGLPPLMEAARLENATVWDKAMARLDADPQAGANLVEELKAKPRATTVEENALLLHRKVALRNEHERAMLQVIADGKPGANVDAITMNANEAREEALHRQIDELDKVTKTTGTEWGRAGQFRRQLAAEDFSLSGMMQRAEAAKGRPLTPEEKASIAAQSQRIQELQKKLDAAEAALAQAGTGAKSPEFEDLKKAQVEAGEARAAFEREVEGDRLSRQPWSKKMEDLLIKVRRAFVISSPKTMLKIIAATAERVAIAPMEEAAGRAWAAVPGIAKIAAMAPREGRGLAAEAEKSALFEGITTGMKDAWDNVKKGHSELDTLYGDTSTPRHWLDWVGSLHAAGKAPAVRAEFTRSFLQRIDHESAQGHDVTSPAALSRIGIAAYKDSQAAKFQQDNRVVDAWNGAIAKLRAKDSSFGARSLGVAMRLAVPVVRIPTNIVAEAFQYSFGSVTGGIRAAAALRSGVETLKPEQADLIMQSLKKGSIGMAAMTLGFLNPGIFGGFYSGRRDDRDVQAGGIKTSLGTIPFWLLHNPLLEVLQMGATVRRALNSTTRGEHPDFATAAASGILGIGEELPMAREAMDIGKKMFNLSPRVRGQYFGELAKSLAVPQLFQWLAGRADTNQQGEVVKRQPQGVLQHIQTGIPGLRNLVPQGR